jgi:hypothetical protein
MPATSITEFPVSNVDIVATNCDGDAIAVQVSSGRYYMGCVDGDVFINAFNVRFRDGVRDDARAVEYFCKTYGFEVD